MVTAPSSAFLAVVFGLLAAAEGLATTMAVREALLIVFGWPDRDHRSPGLRRISHAEEGLATAPRAGGRRSASDGGGAAQWRLSPISARDRGQAAQAHGRGRRPAQGARRDHQPEAGRCHGRRGRRRNCDPHGAEDPAPLPGRRLARAPRRSAASASTIRLAQRAASSSVSVRSGEPNATENASDRLPSPSSAPRYSSKTATRAARPRRLADRRRGAPAAGTSSSTTNARSWRTAGNGLTSSYSTTRPSAAASASRSSSKAPQVPVEHGRVQLADPALARSAPPCPGGAAARSARSTRLDAERASRAARRPTSPRRSRRRRCRRRASARRAARSPRGR